MRDLSYASELLKQEKEQLSSKLESTKKRFTEVQEETQQNQLVFSRDQALNKQSIEFLQRRIEEMQSQHEEKIQVYEQKMTNCRQELQDENNSTYERIKNERDMWEQKYE